MKRALFLATAALLLMLVLAPVAMAQETTMMMEETQMAPGGQTEMTAEGTQPPLGKTGGPAILLPAAALLIGSGVLTYAIVRRR
ncbi:MAG TPA: hypothetical protein VFV45_03800 [Rubrobacteraceae bacterium]|nr:hypothetical protein [Rubrobacteraceae bacterium]